MEKITCATCANEKDRICIIKKNKVSVNKKRRCNKYILAPEKVKAKQILKSVRMSYQEKEALRKEYKEQLKLIKQAARNGQPVQNSRHPLTGDLSRFVSTAGSEE